MTTPQLPPMTATKAWVAGIGTALSVLVAAAQILKPLVPAPWAVAVDAAIGLLTVVGVYWFPNKPKVAQ